MKRLLPSVLAALLSAGVATGQTPGQPRLFLSIYAGYRLGGPLWSLRGQPLPVFVPSGDTAVANNPGQYDTLDLQRRIVPGFLIGTAGAYFPTPGLGFGAELAFLGMSLESRCTIRQYQPADPNDIDPALCASLTGQSVAMSAVNIAVGVIGRINPSGRTTPYARLDAGILARTRGTVEMMANAGTLQTGVFDDPHPNTTNIQLTLGAGVAFALGDGYQLRMEGRDVMTRLDEVTGIAVYDPTTMAFTPPHSPRFYHNFAFVVALDVVFEKHRGRRY